MNTRTIKALKYDDRSQVDFATTDPQKTEFKEMVKELERQTGESWSEYLSEEEVEENTDTGNIRTDAGDVFTPTNNKGDGNYRFSHHQPSSFTAPQADARVTFTVTLTFKDPISETGIQEVADNMAAAIHYHAAGVGIAPEDADTFTTHVQVAHNGVILNETEI